MKFKDFVKNVNEFLKENPEASEFETVYAKDSEGNGFNTVYYSPSEGIFEDWEFQSKESFLENQEDCDDEDKEEFEANAICIN